MLLLGDFAFGQPRLLQVHLVNQFEPSRFVDRPNRAADACERGHDAIQKTFVELARRKVGAREPFDFVDQAAQLLARLVDKFGIEAEEAELI